MIKINLQILEKICFICSWSHHGAEDETGVGSAILISGSEEKLWFVKKGIIVVSSKTTKLFSVSDPDPGA